MAPPLIWRKLRLLFAKLLVPLVRIVLILPVLPPFILLPAPPATATTVAVLLLLLLAPALVLVPLGVGVVWSCIGSRSLEGLAAMPLASALAKSMLKELSQLVPSVLTTLLLWADVMDAPEILVRVCWLSDAGAGNDTDGAEAS